MTRPTEDYERQLWEELNGLLEEAIPAGANREEAERTALLAAMGHDPEIKDRYERVRRLSRIAPGFLRERMAEDNVVSAVRRRLRLSVGRVGEAGMEGAVLGDWAPTAPSMPAPRRVRDSLGSDQSPRRPRPAG